MAVAFLRIGALQAFGRSDMLAKENITRLSLLALILIVSYIRHAPESMHVWERCPWNKAWVGSPCCFSLCSLHTPRLPMPCPGADQGARECAAERHRGRAGGGALPGRPGRNRLRDHGHRRGSCRFLQGPGTCRLWGKERRCARVLVPGSCCKGPAGSWRLLQGRGCMQAAGRKRRGARSLGLWGDGHKCCHHPSWSLMWRLPVVRL